MEHRIERRPAFHVLGLEDRFTKATTKDIPALWGRFVPRMGEVVGCDGDVTYGVCRATTPNPDAESPFLYAVCVEVPALGTIPPDWVGFTIPANTYAVFTHHGHISAIGETIEAIWGQALEDAGLTHVQAPDFEVYDERWDAETGMGDVDIWIPIQP